MWLRSVSKPVLCLYMRCSRLTFHFFVSISRANAPCLFFSADPGQFTNNSATWTVSLPAGWTVVVTVEDSLSDEAWSQPVRFHTTSPAPFLPTASECSFFQLTAFLARMIS
jgi:hypothetical protein